MNAPQAQTQAQAQAPVEVLAADLGDHGSIFCPNPKMPLWSTHPRVFLDVVTIGSAKCPYCSTVYQLKAGEKVNSH